jgi:hypothetical protein
VSLAQKWLAGLIGLGAILIVAQNPRGIASALNAGQRFISGTEHTAITGKA